MEHLKKPKCHCLPKSYTQPIALTHASQAQLGGMETMIPIFSSSPHLILQNHPPITTRHNVRWTPPPEGVIKLNFDGSLSPTGAAAAYLLHDSQG